VREREKGGEIGVEWSEVEWSGVEWSGGGGYVEGGSGYAEEPVVAVELKTRRVSLTPSLPRALALFLCHSLPLSAGRERVAR
jgi:hypothetical protein